MRNRVSIGDFGRVLTRFAASQILSNGLTVIAGFLVIRLVEPEIYGLYSGYHVYLGYVLLMHGGVLNGMSRELPFLLGEGNNEYGKELAYSANGLTFVISVMVSMVFLALSVYHFVLDNNLVALILLSYVFVSFTYLYNSLFLPFLYRTNKDFDKLAVQRIKNGLANLLTILFVYKYGIYGLIFRGLTLAMYSFYLLFKNKPYDLKFNLTRSHLLHLLKIGFPIFLVGRINPLWQTVLNNYIVLAGGPLQYGYYTITLVVQNSVNIIPQSFSQIIYPRMAMMYGQGITVKEILARNMKPLIFQLLFLSMMSSVLFFLIPPLILYFLPSYVGGTEAARWAIFIPVALSFGSINNIYNVIGKQQYILTALVFGAIIGSIFLFYQLETKGFKLEFFSQALLIGMSIQQIISMLFLRKVL